MPLSISEKEDIQSTIENEGFEYTFIDYSDFENIKDKEFHKLRLDYIKAFKALEKYIEV